MARTTGVKDDKKILIENLHHCFNSNYIRMDASKDEDGLPVIMKEAETIVSMDKTESNESGEKKQPEIQTADVRINGPNETTIQIGHFQPPIIFSGAGASERFPLQMVSATSAELRELALYQLKASVMVFIALFFIAYFIFLIYINFRPDLFDNSKFLY